MLIMAVGDAVWSPRMYEYCTMVAPEGCEGTFVAVTEPSLLSAAEGAGVLLSAEFFGSKLDQTQ